MPSRPRDINELARRIVDEATGEVEPFDPTNGTDPELAEQGRKGGLNGGKTRAAGLSPAERSEAASKAAQARWQRTS